MLNPVWVLQPTDAPRLVHVNATAVGGGVAELLAGLTRAQLKVGFNAGWAVISGTDDFYAVTKYLHHLLHEQAAPDRLVEPATAITYRRTLASQSDWFANALGPQDVVVLHDVQTLGLAPAVARTGALVVWHCHVGTEKTDRSGRDAFATVFARELDAVDTVVTTLLGSVPSGIDPSDVVVSCPAVDPSAPKNAPMTSAEVAEVLDGLGLTVGGRTSADAHVEQETLLPSGARVVAQVSRWDPLKDMVGAVRLISHLPDDVHLVLVGTEPAEIPDDPEGLAVLAEVRRVVAGLARHDRCRVHLIKTSTTANLGGALIVNAVQRRADVVLQKSREEGFGLSLTEAMVKGRPVVATGVGGMRLQIRDGENGLLVDPGNDESMLRAVLRLLDDPELCQRLGRAARESATAAYTMPRLVSDYRRICAPRPTVAAPVQEVHR